MEPQSEGGPLAAHFTVPDGQVLSISYHRDGKRLLIHSKKRGLMICRVDKTGRHPLMLTPPDKFVVSGAVWSGDFNRVFAASADARICAWETTDQWSPAVNDLKVCAHSKAINTICAHASNRWLATGSDDKAVKIWQCEGLRFLTSLTFSSGITATAAHPSLDVVAVGDRSGLLSLSDLRIQGGAPVKSQAASPSQRIWQFNLRSEVGHVEWNPTGGSFAVCTDDAVSLWDFRRTEEKMEERATVLQKHSERRLAGCCFNPTGQMLLGVGDGETPDVWDLSVGRVRYSLEGHLGKVTGGSWSPDGRCIATVDDTGCVIIWNVPEVQKKEPVELVTVELITRPPAPEEVETGTTLGIVQAQLTILQEELAKAQRRFDDVAARARYFM